ncbi:MAG: hypothetical protein KGL39_04190 [Patescibacteria group bacterium]|nr:hypothetical protein [Patescibacteria group bacterium]
MPRAKNTTRPESQCWRELESLAKKIQTGRDAAQRRTEVYRELVDEHGFSAVEIAQRLGLAASGVRRSLKRNP